MPVKKNVPQFYTFQTLGGLETGFAMPIFVIFFISKGLNLTEFMGIMSIFNLSVFLFEIPSGALADVLGRKKCIALGATCMAIATAGMIVFTGLIPLTLSFIIWGLGEALISGADSALLYDSLDNPTDFAKIFGRANTARLTATVLGTLICGLSIEYFDISAPMWGAFIASLLSIGVVTTFKDQTNHQPEKKSLKAHIRQALLVFSKNHYLFIIALFGIAFHRVCGLVERPLSQPLLIQNGFSESTIGYMHSIFFLAAAVGSFWVYHLIKKGDIWAFGGAGTLALVSLYFLGYADAYFLPFALIGIYVVKGITFPMVQHSLNQHIPSQQRATCLSMAKMGSNFTGVILGPLFGFFADSYSVTMSTQILQWSFMACFIILLWFLYKRKPRS